MSKNNNPLDHYSEVAKLAIIVALVLFAISVALNAYTLYGHEDYQTPEQIEETAFILGLG